MSIRFKSFSSCWFDLISVTTCALSFWRSADQLRMNYQWNHKAHGRSAVDVCFGWAKPAIKIYIICWINLTFWLVLEQDLLEDVINIMVDMQNTEPYIDRIVNISVIKWKKYTSLREENTKTYVMYIASNGLHSDVLHLHARLTLHVILLLLLDLEIRQFY